MENFSHQKMDVYRVTREFVAWADRATTGLAAGRAHLGDQLRRAASSILLNVAEGAGEFAPRDKTRFYRMARRSATECAAILDILEDLQAVSAADAKAAGDLVVRIVQMLTRLVARGAHRHRTTPES